MNKAELRKHYLAIRKTLTPQERQGLAKRVLRQFETIKLQTEPTIAMSYRAIAHHAEFDPAAVEQSLLKKFPQIRFCYPKVLAAGMDAFVFIEGKSSWKNSGWGIPEITEGELVPPEHIDLIIVPSLIFDQKGFRVGYGKGYYDRFLQDCRSDVLTLGCSFFEPVAQIDDLHTADLRLRYGITPESVFEF